jgi:ATP-dependent Lhr-like helicase
VDHAAAGLAKDIGRAMEQVLFELGLQWKVGIRNGDTSLADRQKQKRQMPEVLIITPESLHLLLAQKGYPMFLKQQRSLPPTNGTNWWAASAACRWSWPSAGCKPPPGPLRWRKVTVPKEDQKSKTQNQAPSPRAQGPPSGASPLPSATWKQAMQVLLAPLQAWGFEKVGVIVVPA